MATSESTGPVRVVHYLNQYFAGIGGEDKADTKPGIVEKPLGPAVGLQRELGTQGTVVATVYSGDNYLAQQGPAGAEEVVALLAKYQPDVVVAGPSFGSGRYGLACGEVCASVQRTLQIPAVAAMHRDSPGAEQYRRQVVIVATRETAVGMGAALSNMARVALKLARGIPLGAPEEEGTVPTGIRRNEFAEQPGAVRAVRMLLSKLSGDQVVTEWPLPTYDLVPPPPALGKQAVIKLALVAEGGVVPKGNPDRFPSAWATSWAKYDLRGVDDLSSASHETVHGGFDTTAANRDPDRLAPVDAARELEREGRISLHNALYSIVGGMGSISDMRRLGAEMAEALRADGVDAVLVGAT